MFESQPRFGRVGRLVTLAGAGHFDLPAEVLEAHRTALRLDAERRRGASPEPVNEARHQLVEALRSAAREESPKWPDGATVVAAEAAHRAALARHEAVERATAMAMGEVTTLVEDLADDIFTGHLRPAMAALLVEARTAAKEVAPHGTTAAALLRAPAGAREAFLALDDLAARYGAIREARRILVEGDENFGEDAEIAFGEIRNLPDVWPGWRKQGSPPWPTDSGRSRLIWLVTSDGVDVWLPTAAETVARWRTYFAADLERMQHARAVAAGGRMISAAR